MDDFREVDFDPNTMTRATAADIARIWLQLWGNRKMNTENPIMFDADLLDKTQEV